MEMEEACIVSNCLTMQASSLRAGTRAAFSGIHGTGRL